MPSNFSTCQEERLVNLERDSKETTAVNREYGVQIKHLSEKIQENGVNMTLKLDEISKNLGSQLEANGQKLDKMAESLHVVHERVGKIEEVEETRIKRTNTVKKIIMAALIAAAGVLGTKAAEKYIISNAVADVGVVAKVADQPPPVKPTTGGK